MFKALIASLLIISSTAMAETKTYNIKGMDCDECRKNLEAEVCKLPKLETCKVEMGKITLESKASIDDSTVKKAVEKAGHYKIADNKESDKKEKNTK